MVLLDDDDVRTNRQLADIPYCRAELCGLRGTSRLQMVNGLIGDFQI